MNYSEEQQYAIDLAADRQNRLVGVTGEAGTGKTTILKAVYEALSSPDLLVRLAAPTGRAAKRIEEATGIKAVTIHRMMRYSMPDDDDEAGLPAHNPRNPLPWDVVLIDEASMVNEELYRNVIDALKPGACIRFFGDANQLPPVQGKSPFLALLNKFPSAKLTHNYRSDDGVVTAARQILTGRIPSNNDQFTMYNPGTGELFSTIEKYIDDRFRTFDYQLITPVNKGKYGTVALNNWLQQRLNPSNPGITLVFKDKKTDEKVENTFRVGDKVICTKNDYNVGVMNGMIGFIDAFDDDGNISVEFEDRIIVFPPIMQRFDENSGRSIFRYDPREQLNLAYAITTHKAQGSEFRHVLLILNKCFILDRRNFYTAVTRARDKVHVIVGPGALKQAMSQVSNAYKFGG